MAALRRFKACRFGSFTLDLERGALFGAGGEDLPLRPKSFTLLRLLAENAGRLLSKEAIMESVWSNGYVTEDNVTQCIHEIRSVLGAESNPPSARIIMALMAELVGRREGAPASLPRHGGRPAINAFAASFTAQGVDADLCRQAVFAFRWATGTYQQTSA